MRFFDRRSSSPGWEDLEDVLPDPIDAGEREDLLWKEFQAWFRSYSRAAANSRRAYQVSKLSQLVLAAAVTVLAAISGWAWVTASFAAAVVVLQGAEQLLQWHANWISYRSNAETLRRHGLAFAARTAPYDGAASRRALLASVLWDVTTSESVNWARTMRDSKSAIQGEGA